MQSGNPKQILVYFNAQVDFLGLSVIKESLIQSIKCWIKQSPLLIRFLERNVKEI